MIASWFQECIYWMKSVIWRHPLERFIFSVIVLLFHGKHLKRFICQGHCVYFATLVATIHIITSGLWLIRKKMNMFFWGKLLYSCSFKGAYLFYRTSCSNICLKSAVLNARKYVQPPHCLFVNVLICNFTIVISAIH